MSKKMLIAPAIYQGKMNGLALFDSGATQPFAEVGSLTIEQVVRDYYQIQGMLNEQANREKEPK